jgi:hypothetical protein
MILYILVIILTLNIPTLQVRTPDHAVTTPTMPGTPTGRGSTILIIIRVRLNVTMLGRSVNIDLTPLLYLSQIRTIIKLTSRCACV